MIRKSIGAVVCCLLLVVVAGQACGEDSVRLEYKFTAKELLRYKMISNMTMTMGMDIPGMGSMPSIPMQSVMIIRQRTKRVLENGDAEIVGAIESMKVVVEDHVEEIPVDKMPTFTMVMSNNGTVKSIKGMEKLQAAMGGMQFMDTGGLSNLMQSAVFPDRELKVGDAWTQDAPFPMGDGNVTIQSELLSTDSTLGKHKVAVIKQDFDADFSMAMTAPMVVHEAGEDITTQTTGRMSGTSTLSFSAGKGQVIRTDGKMNARMTTMLNASGVESTDSITMNIDMQMDFEMFLLPPEKEK